MNNYMNRSKSSALTPVETALGLIQESLNPITETETIALLQANGRILAQAVIASIDVPPHDNSAMDGYAIRAADAQNPPIKLRLTQRIVAGRVGAPLSSGEAARIFTGAPLPPGADSVIMQENCVLEGAEVTLLQAVPRGNDVRLAGEDIKAGTCLFKQGHRLRPQDVGTLSSVGINQMVVRRRLKVALLATGNELIQPGIALQPGQIYNSNFFSLAALLTALGCEVLQFDTVPDSLASTQKALLQAASVADCIITTGGVSVGDEDHVKAAVETLGILEFWKLAIKPGKPLACGKVQGKQFFGLPGNPVSSFVTFCMIVRPCLLAMLGCSNIQPARYRIAANFSWPRSGERQEYLRAVVGHDADGRQYLLPGRPRSRSPRGGPPACADRRYRGRSRAPWSSRDRARAGRG